MSAIATTVAGLGVGAYPFQRKVIQYGPTGQEERWFMFWRDDYPPSGAWVMDPQETFTWKDNWPMANEGSGPTFSWGYLSSPIPVDARSGPGLTDTYFRPFGQSGYGWQPRPIRHAGAAFAAGLTLQESMNVCAWGWDTPDVIDISTVWYPKNAGDSISNTDIPDSYIGITYRELIGVRRYQRKPWQNSGVQACAKLDLMPHLYSTRFKIGRVEDLWAKWRWVAIP
jgi:hypothetical protein